MSGNIIGLYGNTNSNVTVSARNTTGLYTGPGGVTVTAGSTYGNANVEALLLTYTGNIQAGNLTVLYDANVGAIYTDNYYYANGQPFAGSGNSTYGNANVAAYLSSGTVVTDITTTANVTAGGVSTPAVYNNGMVMQGYDFVQMQYSNAVALPVTPYDIGVGSWFYLDPGGAVFQSNTTGTLQTVTLDNNGNISASGNITAPYYFGNGSQLTGIAASYGNANVSNFLANGFGSNTIITTGNIEAGNVLLGDLLGAGNVVSTGNVTAQGNVLGTYFIGNGSQLTGLPATYGNANVAAFLPTYTGDLQAGNIAVLTNETVGGTLDVTGNITGSGYLRTTGVSGNIIGANYVSANYFVGNGFYLTDIASSYGNANVAAFLPVYTGNIQAGNIVSLGNITVQGNLFSDDITSTGVTVYGDQIITGNLTVQGNTTTINSNVITTNDKTITVANNQSTGANVNGAGIEAGNPAIATWLYNDLTTSWQSNIGITPIANVTQNLGGASNYWNQLYVSGITAAGNINSTGNVAGAYVLGNGSQLTGLPATYGNADVTSLLAAFGSNSISTSGNITAGYFLGNGSALSSLTGGNVTGTVANATYATSAGSATTAVTVTGAAQANITSVGTLSALSVTGNITSSGNISGSYFLGNGSQLTGLPATYGNANVAAYLPTYTGAMTAMLGNVTTTANVSANYFLGNGSQLTGIAGTYGNANVVSLLAAFGSNSISTTGNVTAGYFLGNGSALTSLTAANVTGTVANATYATSAGSATSATTAVTVTGNAQANITSVGTLSNLSVTGNVTASGNVSGAYVLGNGTALTGINAFGNIVVAGQSNVAAGNTSGTFTLVAGTNITITTDAANNKITLTSTATGAGSDFNVFLLAGM